MPYFHTIQQIINANRNRGNHFFSKESMRFFSSRVHCEVYNGCYFVTSEKFDWKSPRLYTVRKANSDGTIETVGDFQAFDTRSKAHTFAKNL